MLAPTRGGKLRFDANIAQERVRTCIDTCYHACSFLASCNLFHSSVSLTLVSSSLVLCDRPLCLVRLSQLHLKLVFDSCAWFNSCSVSDSCMRVVQLFCCSTLSVAPCVRLLRYSTLALFCSNPMSSVRLLLLVSDSCACSTLVSLVHFLHPVMTRFAVLKLLFV